MLEDVRLKFPARIRLITFANFRGPGDVRFMLHVIITPTEKQNKAQLIVYEGGHVFKAGQENIFMTQKFALFKGQYSRLK